MKIKYPGRCCASVTITCSQLLKYVHIPKLQVVMFIDMIMKACKKPVLIKIIIHDLLSEIDEDFTGQNKGEGSWLKSFPV